MSNTWSSTATSTWSSTETSDGSAGTTTETETTTQTQVPPVEFATASLEKFTTLFKLRAEVPAGVDLQNASSALPAACAAVLAIPQENVACSGFVEDDGVRRLAIGDDGVEARHAAARQLTTAQGGYFEMDLFADQEETAALYTFLASTLNVTALQEALEATGVNVVLLSVAGVVTARDEQPWTTRGNSGITVASTYEDDEVGNHLIRMFGRALSNVSTADNVTFQVDMGNINIFKTSREEPAGSTGTDDMGILFFINSFRAEEDLAILGLISQPEYKLKLQSVLDEMGVEISIGSFAVVFDVFGKITIKSDADALEDQVKLTNPGEFDIEAMKVSMRDSAKIAYDLRNECVGISLLNVVPHSESNPNTSNHIEMAYLYMPESFEGYCEVAADQQSAAGQERLELSLSYPGVDPTILPVIDTFYQDPTLSCIGSRADAYDAPSLQATAYAVLFAMCVLLVCFCSIGGFCVRSAIQRHWKQLERAGAASKLAKSLSETIDVEAPMEEDSMMENRATLGIPSVRGTLIQINLPSAEPTVDDDAPLPSEMVLQFPDMSDDEPEVERGCDLAEFEREYQNRNLDDDEDLEDLLDSENDESPHIYPNGRRVPPIGSRFWEASLA